MQALVPHCPLSQLTDALELLYACNTTQVMRHYTRAEQRHRQQSLLLYGRQTKALGDTNFWIWNWGAGNVDGHAPPEETSASTPTTTTTTTTATQPQQYSTRVLLPFRALHTAAQVTDCLVPFLLLALRAHPTQVRLPDHHDHHDLSLHSVAQGHSKTNGCCRKSMSLTLLVAAYPKPVHAKNKQGKTPVQLEAASGSVVE